MNKGRIDKYESGVSAWLSRQSVFYQFFNALRLVGFTGTAFMYFLGIFLKLMVLLIVVGIIAFIYIGRQHHDQGYADKQAAKIQKSLKAEKVTLSKFKGGIFAPVSIKSLKIEGSDQSFFSSLKASNLKMDLGNKIMIETNRFRTPLIEASRMEITPKTRADQGSGEMYQSFFQMDSWFAFSTMRVQSFNCSWGYSESTAGSITDSEMFLKRSDQGCMIELKGGTLKYSWMKEVEIESMIMVLTPTSFQITEGKFKRDDAEFALQLQVDSFGDNPVVSGGGTVINCNIDELIREEFTPYIAGVVDSQFTFSGSPNSKFGLDFTFKPLNAREQKGKFLKLTYEIPLIKALGTVDRSINYRNQKFNYNQWEVQTRGGEIFVSDVLLRNELNLVNIKMEFALKSPTQSYIDATLNEVPQTEYFSLLQRPWLEKTGLEMIESRKSIDDALGASSLTIQDYRELLMTEKHFYGSCSIFLHEESFVGKPLIKATYPVNEDGLREVKLPLEGHISTLTRQLANEFYFLSHKRQ